MHNHWCFSKDQKQRRTLHISLHFFFFPFFLLKYLEHALNSPVIRKDINIWNMWKYIHHSRHCSFLRGIVWIAMKFSLKWWGWSREVEFSPEYGWVEHITQLELYEICCRGFSMVPRRLCCIQYYNNYLSHI